jgi:hypothetical protein
MRQGVGTKNLKKKALIASGKQRIPVSSGAVPGVLPAAGLSDRRQEFNSSFIIHNS